MLLGSILASRAGSQLFFRVALERVLILLWGSPLPFVWTAVPLGVDWCDREDSQLLGVEQSYWDPQTPMGEVLIHFQESVLALNCLWGHSVPCRMTDRPRVRGTTG